MNRKRLKQDMIGIAYSLPSLILIICFMVIPIIMTFDMSLHNRTLKKDVFIGFDNYTRLFTKDITYQKALTNTFLYVLVLVPSIVFISMYLSSVIVRKSQKAGAFYRGLFYIPTIASGVTVSIIWSWVFNPVTGIANYIISVFGGKGLEWFSGRSTAFMCVCIVSFFCSIGQPVVLYTAALNGIDRGYYEAAEIDGAGPFKQFIHITVPGLRPTTLYITIITAVNAFQIFIPIQLLTSGGPVNSTISMMFMLYKTAFTDFKFGYAAAMGVILLILISIFSVVQFILQRKE
ncbi:MAG: acetylneuraminate ABC transporter permease [Clostridiales bacterium]|nr:acetylneuraminate ABC transporter permease [Clostridiales bacterium]